MVSKGLAGAAALAMALASAGAFVPGRAFVRNPLMPSSYGIEVSQSVSYQESVLELNVPTLLVRSSAI